MKRIMEHRRKSLSEITNVVVEDYLNIVSPISRIKQKIRMAFNANQPVVVKGRKDETAPWNFYEIYPGWVVLEISPHYDDSVVVKIPPDEEDVIDFLIEKGVKETSDIKLKSDKEF